MTAMMRAATGKMIERSWSMAFRMSTDCDVAPPTSTVAPGMEPLAAERMGPWNVGQGRARIGIDVERDGDERVRAAGVHLRCSDNGHALGVAQLVGQGGDGLGVRAGRARCW